MNGIIDRIPFKNIMVLRTSIIILSGYGEIKLKVLFFLLSSSS